MSYKKTMVEMRRRDLVIIYRHEGEFPFKLDADDMIYHFDEDFLNQVPGAILVAEIPPARGRGVSFGPAMLTTQSQEFQDKVKNKEYVIEMFTLDAEIEQDVS